MIALQTTAAWAATVAKGGFKVDTGAVACAPDRAFLADARKTLPDPVLKAFQDVLRMTELADGCGALQMIDAQMASHTNGFSIGAAQLDVHQRPVEGWALLQSLKASCTPEVSDPQLRLQAADDDVFQSAILTRTTWELRQDPALWSKLLALRPKVEALLRTKCGIGLMRPQYTAHLEHGLDRATQTRDLMFKTAPALSKQKAFIWLYALDYGNVQGDLGNFELALAKGTFCGPKLCASGATQPFAPSNPLLVTDLPRYALGFTCWGFVPEGTRQHDALRRLDRVLEVAPLDYSALEAGDIAWIQGELATVLAQARADFPDTRFPALGKLLTQAGVAKLPSPPPTSTERLSELRRICAK